MSDGKRKEVIMGRPTELRKSEEEDTFYYLNFKSYYKQRMEI